MEGRHSTAKHAAPSKHSAPREEARERRSVSSYRDQVPTRSDGYGDYEEREEYQTPVRRSSTVQPTARSSGNRAYSGTAEVTPSRRSAPEEREYRDRPVRKPAKSSPYRVPGDIGRILLLTVVILLVFATFHHVLPRITDKKTVVEPISSVTVTPTPTPTPVPPKETLPVSETEEPTAPEEPEVIDTRTEWQKKFEDKFTDEVVITENSYSSPNVSITLETVAGDLNGYYQTYYVADIYIAQIENFQTYFANNAFTYYGAEDRNTISKHAGAILSINGDYCNNQKNGLLVRNGQVFYDDELTADICALYYDGSVETFSPGQYTPEDILAKNPFQTWKFGPRLLDENGEVMTSFNTTSVIETEAAPRSGFGYYEPGHYCFVMADGRQGHARGLVLKEFAQIFKDLGCTCAYNMDGGASAVLYFNGSVFNKPSAVRDLGDILLIAELPEEPEEGEVQ